ncbi:TRAP transporter large permease subunit [Bacillus hwajinpoensis]|uniref:TRAP transporter large permease subunit n=1 Tax=Guptibacillus hwajinpoensis TaxID=208199 RepID=A0A845ESX2_9BACL|nr:TRAP transporter large permease [Pseudalkalibacillus hwajinpoensis]MYL62320.1 TRAP transporter large permease subunit [Pseudalkalibacillus hwajinpoensis]
MIALLFISFFLLLILGVPVGISLGVASIFTILYEGSIPLLVVPQKMFISMDSFTLLAIPFFMLTGVIMDKSGLTQKLVNFADSIIGWTRGGMSYVSVSSGMLMGGISGSAPADTAALSSVMTPSMVKMGFPARFAAALQAASGSIGIIIPPSIPMVVLGGIASISVGKLFLGGIIPGLLIGILLMVVSGFICSIKNYGSSEKKRFSITYFIKSFRKAILPLMAPIIIVGGILTGIFTPTESSVIAVVYTLILGLAVYKSIKLKDMTGIFVEAIISSGNVLLIIAASSLFSWILISHNFPQILSNLILSISDNPIFIILVINVIFIVGGMFIEGLALLIMFVPIMLPIAMSAGMDPVVFGVMIVINIAIGTLTPPVGVCLFVACSSSGVKLDHAMKSAVPFVGVLCVALLLIVFFPTLVTFIPNLIE